MYKSIGLADFVQTITYFHIPPLSLVFPFWRFSFWQPWHTYLAPSKTLDLAHSHCRARPRKLKLGLSELDSSFQKCSRILPPLLSMSDFLKVSGGNTVFKDEAVANVDFGFSVTSSRSLNFLEDFVGSGRKEGRKDMREVNELCGR